VEGFLAVESVDVKGCRSMMTKLGKDVSRAMVTDRLELVFILLLMLRSLYFLKNICYISRFTFLLFSKELGGMRFFFSFNYDWWYIELLWIILSIYKKVLFEVYYPSLVQLLLFCVYLIRRRY
jgi:hypothetical protein